MMKSVREIENLDGKRVLVRVDWNVPIVDGVVADDFRIKKSMPTLEFLKNAGAKVIIATHFSGDESSFSLLNQYVPLGAELLSNLRQDSGEEENNESFAKSLVEKADVYVNEAFSVSHREHASIVGVPKFLPSYAGLLFVQEVSELSKVFKPSHPFLFILGGAKFETKLPLVEKFLEIADTIFIGGLLAGSAVKTSLKEKEKIVFPHGDIDALDVDDETISMLEEKINTASFILWNGPLGNYENGYKNGTLALASLIADSGKTSVVGGGDTLATIKELGIEDKFTFVSTGGGAMLDFLATGTLPGIEALN
ncbi:MAG: phosphoglycerate kinase, partial [Parcubacteria group bacterium]